MIPSRSTQSKGNGEQTSAVLALIGAVKAPWPGTLEATQQPMYRLGTRTASPAHKRRHRGAHPCILAKRSPNSLPDPSSGSQRDSGDRPCDDDRPRRRGNTERRTGSPRTSLVSDPQGIVTVRVAGDVFHRVV